MKKLKTGVAYHGNRMLSHAIADMQDIARSDMDIVVHMLSHNDWERHDKVMKDIFAASEDAGLEVWVDNWGIGGAPGDKSHFLGYHPEAHSYYGDGIMHPYQICLNSPAYRQFVKDWVDEVASLGGKTIFWDEPHIPRQPVEGTDRKQHYAACTCPTCRKMFEERFGKRMPVILDADVASFRDDTVIDFHRFISDYAAEAGMKSVICFMPYQLMGINNNVDPYTGTLDINDICRMPNIHNVGTDPYWFGNPAGEGMPYKYVYDATRACVETADRHGKDHNIWIQAYNAPRGREDEIITAIEAAYDAGARNILYWSYGAGESNNYRSSCPGRSWQMTVEGNRRIKTMERDRLHEENKKKYAK